jgi:hypothetical protein
MTALWPSWNARNGRTGLGRLLMGSVAEQVVRKAPCPVLTVKTPLCQAPAAQEAGPMRVGEPAAVGKEGGLACEGDDC